ncbi:MAG: hypothetical protein ACLU99_06350 [Alphaproteobacteria bacterium]
MTIAAWGDDYDSVTPEIGYEFVVKIFRAVGYQGNKIFQHL